MTEQQPPHPEPWPDGQQPPSGQQPNQQQPYAGQPHGYPTQGGPPPGYDPGSAPQGGYPSQPYPAQGAPGQPPQSYPTGAQGYPTQGYPAQGFPTQGQPPPGYPQGGPGFSGPPPAPGGYGPAWQPDYLNAPAPGPRKNNKKGLIIGAAVVVVALGISGGAYAALSGGSDKNSSHNGDNQTLTANGKADPSAAHLPSDSIAVASVNLDPGATQTVNALKYLRKFPTIATSSSGDTLTDGILSPLLSHSNLNFDADIKPWLGSHVSVAVDPQDGKAHPVVAIQTKDADKANAFFAQEAKDDPTIAYQISDGYVIVSDTPAAVTAAINGTKAGNLSKNANFSSDIKHVPSDAIVSAWVDVKASLRYAESTNSTFALPDSAQGAVPDRLVAGLSFDGTAADLQLTTFGGVTITKDTGVSTRIAKLPDDTSVAVGVSGLDKLIAQNWGAISQMLDENQPGALTRIQDQTGLTLPDDLETLVGSQTVVAVGTSRDQIGVETTTDPDKAKAVLEKLDSTISDSGASITVKTDGNGIVAASSDAYAADLQQGGSLGAQKLFKAAVPNADDASSIIYVNVAQVEQLAGAGADSLPADASPIKAVGITGSSDGSQSTVHIRVVAQ